MSLRVSNNIRLLWLTFAIACAIAGVVLLFRGGERPPDPVVPANLASLDPAVAEQIREFESALGNNPRRDEVRLQLAMFYEANGFHRLAIQTHDQLLARDNRNGLIWFRRAICLEREGDLQAAIDSMEQSIHFEPEYAPSRWYQANWLLNIGDNDKAEQRVAEALQLDSDDPHAKLVKARLLVSQGKLDEAIRFIEGEKDSFGRNVQYADLLLGTAYRQQGDQEKADQLLAHSQSVRPEWYDDWSKELSQFQIGLARLRSTASNQVRAGEFTKAIPALQQILAQDPKDIRTWNLLGAAYLNLGRIDEGVDAFRHAVAINEAHFSSQLNLASALSALVDQPDATAEGLQHAQRACELQPQSGKAFQIRAALLERMGDYEAALASYVDSFNLDSRSPSAAVSAALLEVKLGQLDAAERRLDDIWDRRTQSPEICVGMAYVRVAQGRTDEASALLDEAERQSLVPALRQLITALRQHLATVAP